MQDYHDGHEKTISNGGLHFRMQVMSVKDALVAEVDESVVTSDVRKTLRQVHDRNEAIADDILVGRRALGEANFSDRLNDVD